MGFALNTLIVVPIILAVVAVLVYLIYLLMKGTEKIS